MKGPVKEDKKAVDTDSLETLRSEVNFLVYPFFVLSRKGLGSKGKIEYRAVVERGGEKLEVSWKVIPNPEYGHPGLYAKEVHKAVEQIINSLRPPIENPIPLGSLAHIAQLMGLKPSKEGDYSGRVYQKIKEALKSIIATMIESKGTFYSKGKRRWIEDVFHLYERVVFKGEELPDGRIADTNYLFLSSRYLDNINAGYTKPLDWDYYRSLESPIAQRLYEIIGVKLYRVFSEDLSYLRYRYSTLCQLLPITRQRYLSKAKEKLEGAHDELIETLFLSEVEWKGIRGRKDWLIYYYPGPRARAEAARYKGLEQGWAEVPELPGQEGGGEREREAEAEGALPLWFEGAVKVLVEDILRVTGDEHSRPFYQKLARLAADDPRLQDLIYRCLSEVKEEAHQGLIRTTKGAVFTDKIKRYCKERGIDLGLKTR